MRRSGFAHVVVVALLTGAACAVPAWAQIYPSVSELGHNADLIAFATVDQAEDARSATTPDATLTVHLRLGRVLKGSAPSSMVSANLAERCSGGGSGGGPFCIWTPGNMAGLTGLWFLQSGEGGYRILPRYRSFRSAEGLFLPLPDPSPGAASPAAVEDLLLAYQVRWIQSLPEQRDTFGDDEQFFSAFVPWTSPLPAQHQVLKAIAPLLASPSPWKHAIGLVIALRADSAAAMNQVVDELPTLKSNPRFQEIVFAIGAFPLAPGVKDPAWLAPLRRLLALHANLPGMDAAAAGALYRIGTRETWPLVADLLESKDPTARTIAARTLSLRFSSTLPGQPAPPQDVEFWKTWWSQNRASLVFPPSPQ
jgi:hypothetical protein